MKSVHTELKSSRYDNLDFLEFLAMLFVVVYHTSMANYDILGMSSDVLIYIRFLCRPILSICVPIFFFVNGFLLLNRKFDLKKHLIKIVRLVVLTSIWSVINILSIMIIKGESLSVKEFLTIWWHFDLGWTNHLWFMGALVCLYILFPLIKITFDNHEKAFLYWTVITMILTFGNVVILNSATIIRFCFTGEFKIISTNVFNQYNPFYGIYGYSFAYFCLGGLFGKKQDYLYELINNKRYIIRIILSLTLLISTIFLGIWGVFCTKSDGVLWDTVWNGYDSIFTLINVIIVYILSVFYKNNGNIFNKFILIVSKNTLCIYFIHMIFVTIIKELKINTIPYMDNYISNFICALIIIILCLIITWIFKKIPLINKLFKL